MSQGVSFFPVAASALTAFAIVAAVFMAPSFAHAADAAGPPGCSCPDGSATSSKPNFTRLSPPLDASDEIAALQSLQFALTEVADGSSYVWHRSHGRLSGIVRPLRSHKDGAGAVCRTIVVILNGTDITKKTETTACRLAGGVWQIAG